MSYFTVVFYVQFCPVVFYSRCFLSRYFFSMCFIVDTPNFFLSFSSFFRFCPPKTPPVLRAFLTGTKRFTEIWRWGTPLSFYFKYWVLLLKPELQTIKNQTRIWTCLGHHYMPCTTSLWFSREVEKKLTTAISSIY